MNYEFRNVNNSGRSRTGWLQLLTLNSALLTLFSCSVQKQISKSATENVLATPVLQTAHVGISIYEPATGKYWFDYQGDHYFVPASNTKLPTCYAAMKYLGDSLVGLKYATPEDKKYNHNLVVIQPTGDPTFLLAEYQIHPTLTFLKQLTESGKEIGFMDTVWKDEKWASGWTWNDWDADYMAERSSMPIWGNVINIKLQDPQKRLVGDTTLPWISRIRLFKTQEPYFDSLVNSNYQNVSVSDVSPVPKTRIERNYNSNEFLILPGKTVFSSLTIPFVTNDALTAATILQDKLKTTFAGVRPFKSEQYLLYRSEPDPEQIEIKKWNNIYSQATDSVLKPMMHRSDNFFAEQSLLMVSNELLGVMNDSKIIDTLLKTDFKDLPQKPRWADGSGLSRYNLFSPRDFVTILNKMKNEFGMERIKTILPTGGEGTISSYYKTEAGYIFAKTGTLSGVVAFSGFLYTKKGKLLIFSTLVNNHNGSATDIRKAIEKFLQEIRNKY